MPRLHFNVCCGIHSTDSWFLKLGWIRYPDNNVISAWTPTRFIGYELHCIQGTAILSCCECHCWVSLINPCNYFRRCRIIHGKAVYLEAIFGGTKTKFWQFRISTALFDHCIETTATSWCVQLLATTGEGIIPIDQLFESSDKHSENILPLVCDIFDRWKYKLVVCLYHPWYKCHWISMHRICNDPYKVHICL